MVTRRARAISLVWLLWAITAATAWLNLSILGGLPDLLSGVELPSRLSHAVYLLQPLAIASVAALIASRRADNLVGGLLLVGAAMMALQGFAQLVPTSHAVSVPEVRTAMAWFANWSWAPAETLLELALVLFPTGRPPSRRWQPVIAGMAALSLLTALVAATLAGPLEVAPDIDNPLAIHGPLADAVAGRAATLIPFASAVLVLVAATSIVVRFVGSRGEVRQQMKWLAYAATAAAAVTLSNALGVLGVWGDAASNVALAGLPLGIGVALLRYRLYEIDLLINRTLVYAVLSVLITAVSVLLASVIGSAVGSPGPQAFTPSLLLAGSVALVFAPLRDRVQRAVNRLLYGQRDEPYTAISRLAQRLEVSPRPGEALPVIAQAVRDALKLPYAAVELHDSANAGVLARAANGALQNDPIRFPLVYQQQRIGDLVVSPRAPGEAFDAAEQRLLADLARQAGVVAHAVRLNADLQRSRERLVVAREEERRRLRRELHDGLGPTLAGLALKLETARRRLRHVPEAEALLGELAERAQRAVGDVRRVVYGLRPPALDDLGLVEALRQQAQVHTANGLDVHVDASADMTGLPAAIEAAAFRIAVEALTNAARHSGARRCVIHLARRDERLALDVEDDGHGIAVSALAGVGTASMRERAEELGGDVTVASAASGTRVSAVLPIGPLA